MNRRTRRRARGCQEQRAVGPEQPRARPRDQADRPPSRSCRRRCRPTSRCFSWWIGDFGRVRGAERVVGRRTEARQARQRAAARTVDDAVNRNEDRAPEQNRRRDPPVQHPVGEIPERRLEQRTCSRVRQRQESDLCIGKTEFILEERIENRQHAGEHVVRHVTDRERHQRAVLQHRSQHQHAMESLFRTGGASDRHRG